MEPASAPREDRSLRGPQSQAEVVGLRVPVADGLRLHVRGWPGEPGRVPFVLVHGLSSNARLWDGVAAHLSAAGHQAYAVDLRSHGESDRPSDGYDTATAATDVAAVMRRLDLPPAVVVGQSWGGNVTVALAATEKVRAVALVDGGWIDLRAQFDSWQACERALRPADIDGMPAADLRAHLRRAHPDWEDWALDATVANLAVDASGHVTRRLSIPAHMSILRSMWDDPPGPRLPSVEAPALLVPALKAGDERKRALVRAAAEALPVATVREYVGADHDVHAQQPKRLAADLLMHGSAVP
jgi:pimeloyl-ACP methyl ester carboxylesterase